MATAGVGDEGEATIELENPPAPLKSPVWQQYVNYEHVIERKTTPLQATAQIRQDIFTGLINY